VETQGLKEEAIGKAAASTSLHTWIVVQIEIPYFWNNTD